MIAVALIVVILAVIAVVAAVVWRRRKQDVGFVSRERASTHTSSFENPLYDSSAPQKSDAIHAAGDTSGYMDVPVDSSGDTSGGYMDVPADANEDFAFYDCQWLKNRAVHTGRSNHWRAYRRCVRQYGQ